MSILAYSAPARRELDRCRGGRISGSAGLQTRSPRGQLRCPRGSGLAILAPSGPPSAGPSARASPNRSFSVGFAASSTSSRRWIDSVYHAVAGNAGTSRRSHVISTSPSTGSFISARRASSFRTSTAHRDVAQAESSRSATSFKLAVALKLRDMMLPSWPWAQSSTSSGASSKRCGASSARSR